MDRIYVVTGANGHLGRHIVAQLLQAGRRVRALVLPGEKAPLLEAANVEMVRGDVRDVDSLRPLFANNAQREVVLIHTAGIIDITSKVDPRAYEVNVNGTKNVVALALEHGVHRFIHVSSVHAIPEPPGRRQIRETKLFSAGKVEGGYAKTKAEATAYVMQCVEEQGLPAVVVHPSGIVGPMDAGSNNVVAVIKGYLDGKFPATPRGGYNLVDVRDVAAACIAAVDKGRVGETYILSGSHCEFSDIFAMLREITGKKGACPVVPMWMAKMAAPFLEWRAQYKKQKPLVTPYALQTIASNDNFCHEKASRELDFWPRDPYETLQDTVDWLRQNREEKAQAKKLRKSLRKKQRAKA